MVAEQDTSQALVQTKWESFGETLKRAIDEEHGSQVAFAQATGMSQSLVSQHFWEKKDLLPVSIRRVLAGFESLRLQEELRRAWAQQYAPLVYPQGLGDDGGLLLRIVNDLAEQFPLQALKVAVEGRAQLTDPIAWQLMTERIVHINLGLERTGAAAMTIDEMELRAKARQDSGDLLTALWMKGNVLRNIDNVSAKRLSRAYDEADSFAEIWQPATVEARNLRQNRRAQMARDYALHILMLNERNRSGNDGLETALQAVDTSIEMGDDPAFYFMGMEVRARIEVALGRLVAAEDHLDEIEEQGLFFGAEILEKTEITRARVLLARNDRDEAVFRLERVADLCFERMRLHHHRRADQLLARAVSGS